VYSVPSLGDTWTDKIDTNGETIPPAIELFIQRAKAIQPSFELNDKNRDTIFNICHRLEGLPLAIELAAGQINLFSPALLLKKLDHRLDVLKGNFRDIPDRQKTIRNTIDWSFDLLSPAEQDLLLQISLYSAGCLLETVEHMKVSEDQDVYTLVASLIDKSLLMKEDDSFMVRYQMLESVREFAIEKLNLRNQYEAYRNCQANYYHQALKGIKLDRNKSNQAEILKYLEKEHPNIRFALDHLMQQKDLPKVAEITWNLWLFWWVNAHTKEAYTWMTRVWHAYHAGNVKFDDYTFAKLATNVGAMAFMQRDFEIFKETLVQHYNLIRQQPDDELVATASLIVGVVKTIIHEHDDADIILQISLERYKRIGLTSGVSFALSALGRNAIYDGKKLDIAREYYKESMVMAKQDENEISEIICLTGFALCEMMAKNSEAKKYLVEGIQLGQRVHFYEALAWSVEIWALVSINEGKYLHAVTLMGAVNHLREITQLPVWDDLNAIILDANQQLHHLLGNEVFEQAWNRGVAMSLDGMLEFAMEEGVVEVKKEMVGV